MSFLFIALPVFSQGDLWSAGLPVLKQAVSSSFSALQNSPNCPASGVVSQDRILQVEDSATAANSAVNNLIEKTQPQLSALTNDASKCGACRQVNQVVIYTTSEPAKVNSDASCDNRPTVNVQVELDNSEIQTFVESTLKGSTPQGKQLYQACPDPCAFYTASAATPSTGNRSLLNLTVHCGQPRNGFILFAKYRFTSGLIQKYTCQ